MRDDMPFSVRRPRILVVDDNPEIIKVLSALLADLGDVSFAMDGHKGLELALKLQPDLVLLDMEMPDMDGLAVCRKMKETSELKAIPVLFMTGGGEVAAELAALDAGAADFLGKPLHPLVVRARISSQLASRSQTLQLLQLVNIDGLTGVSNRRHFDSVLAQEVARQRRSSAPLVVALLDVDCFKAYNDSLGHQKGDECLKAVAQLLSSSLRRPAELFARYGGEEFGVIAPGVEHADAVKLGEWMLSKVKTLALPHPASPVSSVVTVSIGIACGVPSGQVGAKEFLGVADRALYAAKLGGRNVSVVTDVLPP